MPEVPKTRAAAGTRAEELRREINHHAHRYYALDAPEISDAAFDSLMRELTDIEAAYPDLVTPESPTQRIGVPVGDQFAPVQHAQRLYRTPTRHAFQHRRIVRPVLHAGPFQPAADRLHARVHGRHIPG